MYHTSAASSLLYRSFVYIYIYQKISIYTNINTLKAYIWSIIVPGCECWTLTKDLERIYTHIHTCITIIRRMKLYTCKVIVNTSANTHVLNSGQALFIQSSLEGTRCYFLFPSFTSVAEPGEQNDSVLVSKQDRPR